MMGQKLKVLFHIPVLTPENTRWESSGRTGRCGTTRCAPRRRRVADPNRPDEWFRKIDYYLTHDDERTRIQAKGTARALREHTYHNRVTTLLGLYTRQVISATNVRADHG